MNITIGIDPKKWPSDQFFSFFTQDLAGGDPFASGVLAKTDKCSIHGNEGTGLRARDHLMKLIEFVSFNYNGVKYEYHSIGVAANQNYAPAGYRRGNKFLSATSHFEIKFKASGNRFLYLNLHLQARPDSGFGQEAVCERIKVAVNLFYRELGLLDKEFGLPETSLLTADLVTVSDCAKFGYSIEHEDSLAVGEEHLMACSYAPKTFGGFISDHIMSLISVAEHRSKLPPIAGTDKAVPEKVDILSAEAWPALSGAGKESVAKPIAKPKPVVAEAGLALALTSGVTAKASVAPKAGAGSGNAFWDAQVAKRAASDPASAKREG